MTVILNCNIALEQCPLWADGLPAQDVIEKAIDDEMVRLQNCHIHFDPDGMLVIEGMKPEKGKKPRSL